MDADRGPIECELFGMEPNLFRFGVVAGSRQSFTLVVDSSGVDLCWTTRTLYHSYSEGRCLGEWAQPRVVGIHHAWVYLSYLVVGSSCNRVLHGELVPAARPVVESAAA